MFDLKCICVQGVFVDYLHIWHFRFPVNSVVYFHYQYVFLEAMQTLVDPDQLVSPETSQSGSTLFSMTWYRVLKRKICEHCTYCHPSLKNSQIAGMNYVGKVALLYNLKVDIQMHYTITLKNEQTTYLRK